MKKLILLCITFSLFILTGCQYIMDTYVSTIESIPVYDMKCKIIDDVLTIDIDINDPDNRIEDDSLQLIVTVNDNENVYDLEPVKQIIEITDLTPDTTYTIDLICNYTKKNGTYTEGYVIETDTLITEKEELKDVIPVITLEIDNESLWDNVFTFDILIEYDEFVNDLVYDITLHDVTNDTSKMIYIENNYLEDISCDGLMEDVEYEVSIQYSFLNTYDGEVVTGTLRTSFDTIDSIPFEEVALTTKITDVSVYYNLIYSNVIKENFDFEVTCSENIDCESILDDSMKSDIIFDVFNFVHPYLGFNVVDYEYNSEMIHITFSDAKYSVGQKEYIDGLLPIITNSIITEGMTTLEKITAVHDYVVNSTSYDSVCYNDETKCENAYTAYGVLAEDIAVCEGYAETIDILLDYIGITSYRIYSEYHEWNVVLYNGDYYHLDATWDDPITDSGDDVLLYDYFLITTLELTILDTTDNHDFDKSIYNFVE